MIDPDGHGPTLARAPARLIGLDIGSTTTSAVVAEGHLVDAAPGRGPRLTDLRELLRSPLIFTPFTADRTDIAIDPILARVDGWLADADAEPDTLVGGGVLITGLAARAPGAAALIDALRARLGRTLVATARDPRLEAWLAFMGNVADLSRVHPHTHFLNLDIGGGTTNLALGRDGEVLRTGSLLVGARHVQVEPGTHRIVQCSPEARRIFDALAIDAAPGRTLTPAAVDALCDPWIAMLEASVAGEVPASLPFAALLVESPMTWPAGAPIAVVPVFSGGVGELVYRLARGESILATTPHGDLGLDLARRIVRSPVLGAALRDHVPEGGGRSVAYGLLRHATDLSGATLHLPRPDLLPLCDLPIVASVSPDATPTDIASAIALARAALPGACIEVTLPGPGAAPIRALARSITDALQSSPFPAARPLVLLVAHDVGKALGAYLTDWGTNVHRDGIVVVDQVRRPGACFIHLGRADHNIVPVSFFGMR